jgi:hypothetical protein
MSQRTRRGRRPAPPEHRGGPRWPAGPPSRPNWTRCGYGRRRTPERAVRDGGYSLGAQSGEEAIARLARDAGFASFRRVAETPFNIVYQARR